MLIEETNTTLHCVEELAGVPYHLQPEVTECRVVDAAGTLHSIRNRLHLWGWERDFPRVDAPLMTAGAMHIGKIGQAESRLIQARKLRDLLVPILRDDPLYLLTAHARAQWNGGTCEA